MGSSDIMDESQDSSFPIDGNKSVSQEDNLPKEDELLMPPFYYQNGSVNESVEFEDKLIKMSIRNRGVS